MCPSRLTIPADAAELARRGYAGPYMEADGRSWHEQGATDAQELGATLATAVATLRTLDGLNDVHLVRAVGVTLAATQDMFATLAKFRAMRLLWRRVLEAAGLPDAPLRLHAETSWRMMAAHRSAHQHPARHGGRVRRGARRRRFDHRAALLAGAGPAQCLRAPRGAQCADGAGGGIESVARGRSGFGCGLHRDLTQGLCEKAWDVFQNAEAGDWPMPDPSSTASLPVIGTTAYPLQQEYAPEVEALS